MTIRDCTQLCNNNITLRVPGLEWLHTCMYNVMQPMFVAPWPAGRTGYTLHEWQP